MELEDLDGPLLTDSRTHGLGLRVCGALMDGRRGRPIDQQAEQFGAAVMTARVHDPLAGVDLGKVKLGNHFAFARFERLTDDPAVGTHDRREAATRNRP